MIRSPLKAGLVTMRVRISCTSANISSSLLHAFGVIPYASSACGVLPPLWSRAAMNPGCVFIFSSCSSLTSTICDFIARRPFASGSAG
jgi:hypothetical protein